jgi:hypothetical protein
MKTIYKYELSVEDNQIIKMPDGAKFLSLQTQNENPCIWMLVDTENKLVDIHFVTYGTGHEIKSGLGEFVGTYQLNNGRLVFHVFKQN